MGMARRVRDPIHGFVSLDEKEVDIVGTTIFQRLRGIRQLALANLVYPGALHTRFDHSLGVCHVSGLLADSLKFSNSDKDLVRLAALMHDIGHGPFSHVSEVPLELYSNREALGGRIKKREKIHELLTQDMIHNDPQLRHLIAASDLDKITK